MNIKKSLFFAMFFSYTSLQTIEAQQETQELTFDKVIELATTQSPQVYIARHKYRASYWEYKSFRAEFLPQLSMTAVVPSFRRVYSRLLLGDGTSTYVEENTMSMSGGVSLSQNVGLTGGQISISTNLEWLENRGKYPNSRYMTTPISVGYRQPLFAYNDMKWRKKIAPMRYEQARKNYVETVETINRQATELFFDLALGQINFEMAKKNYANNDTLFHIAKGRYNVGTIAQNDLLQFELNVLNASTEQNNAKLRLDIASERLRSYLGFGGNVNLKLIIPTDIPEFEIDTQEAIMLAKENNSEALNLEIQTVQAQSEVRQAKFDNRFQAELNASYGLTQSNEVFADAYSNPQDHRLVQIGITIPILDWGRRRGKYKMAQSNKEMTDILVEQALSDFEQNVRIQVNQFNMQDKQILISQKTDTIAQNRYYITLQRFYIGKVSVLDLNLAKTEKDNARRNYLSALRSYWTQYYQIRRLTLFDFDKNKKIEVDFEKLM